MLKHPKVFFSFALIALVGLSATGARAETITMTIMTSSTTIPVDVFAVPGSNTYTVDAAGLASINALLVAAGSEYQLFGLGGSSNFPGNATQGNLVMTGEIHSVVGGGSDTFLKITESEGDFTAPTGPNGTLLSSSTGNFTNQPAGGGHTASSAFNATSTPTYSVLSSTTAPNGEAGGASVGIAPVSTLYTLTNVITFGLSPAGASNDVVDSFGVTATINTVVPEPSSWVMFLGSMPLPLVVAGFLRRHRRLAA